MSLSPAQNVVLDLPEFNRRSRRQLGALMRRTRYTTPHGFRIGWEDELTVTDEQGTPKPVSTVLREFVKADAGHPYLPAHEVAEYVTEMNGRDRPVSPSVFTYILRELEENVAYLTHTLSQPSFGGSPLSIGTLPTLRHTHTGRDFLCRGNPRYGHLDPRILAMNGGRLRASLEGPDPLDEYFDCIACIGALTSFQWHIGGIPIEDFPKFYNAAQVAMVLALACSANSPLAFGHRTGHDEARLSLFHQFTRTPGLNVAPEYQDRTPFSYGFVRSAEEAFMAVTRWPALLPVLGKESGEDNPYYEALLRIGMMWVWLRPVVYGDGTMGIEIRVLPSGPTLIDNVASGVHLIGLTFGLVDRIDGLIEEGLTPESLKWDLLTVAKHGLNGWITSPGPKRGDHLRPLLAREAVLSTMGIAADGLEIAGLASAEHTAFLDIVHDRTWNGRTGAVWQRAVFDQILHQTHDREAASYGTVGLYMANAPTTRGEPVHTWAMPAGA